MPQPSRLPRTFWFAVLVAVAGVVWTALVVRDVQYARAAIGTRVALLGSAQQLQRALVNLPESGDDPRAFDAMIERVAAVDDPRYPLPPTAGLTQAAQAVRAGRRAAAAESVDTYTRQLRRQTGQISGRLASRWQAMYVVCAAAFALVALALLMWVVAWRRQQNAALASDRLQVALKALGEARSSAEQDSERKSVYLASMSHEMRTPLTGIMGMAEAAARDADSDRQRSQLETMLAASQGLLEIIARVLDHAAIEAGKFELRTAPTSTQDLMDATLAAVQGDATKLGVTIDVRVEADVPAWLQLDGGRLRQVLVNFVGNAVKFSGQGTVLVLVSWVSETLRIEVLDEGPGLPPGDAESLFEPFVRGDASSTRRVGGTGLGLSISRAIAEAMGGRVWAEPRRGGGAVFAVELPAQVAQAPAPVVQVATATVERPATVLVVDDNDINRVVIEALLATDPVHVHAVSSAADALVFLGSPEAPRQPPVDVVLMDCEMPIMDGWEATRAIRERADRTATVPVVAMTAHTDAETRKRCAASGMDDFLSKPLTRADLLGVIGRWTDARSTKRRPHPAGGAAHRTHHAGDVQGRS